MTHPLAHYLEPLPLIAVLRGITPEEIPAVGAALVAQGFAILEVNGAIGSRRLRHRPRPNALPRLQGPQRNAGRQTPSAVKPKQRPRRR